MKAGLLKLGWLILELIVFVALFVAIGFLLLAAIKAISGQANLLGMPTTIDENTDPYVMGANSFLPILISGLAASILTQVYIFKRPYPDLGFVTKDLLSMFGKGWLWSMALIIPGFLLLWLWNQIDLLPPTWNVYYFIGFFLFFIVQSGGEEVLTRAYLINLVEGRFGTLIAVILSASIFAIMHLGNDHFNWIGFTNILLGGFLMALFFILYRNIWICTGLHAGWNFVQASLLDFNVSGIDVYSFIQFKDTGYLRLTGASFGYEGSLLAVVIQSLALVYFIRANKDKLQLVFSPPSIPIPVSDETPPIVGQEPIAPDLP